MIGPFSPTNNIALMSYVCYAILNIYRMPPLTEKRTRIGSWETTRTTTEPLDHARGTSPLSSSTAIIAAEIEEKEEEAEN
ncbi:hypothetical protein EUGRSUZ_K02949 [Eucalyptus grandis]|uniref:Uncharacterized protein n=2 Tax=Eucalyptus grandis TaxID=71139 RepID=A0ACC3J0T2_EUCGR|nr:hypothetical protein EUGRSUZ_K02949 [Eucalyptus grandis]